MPTLEEIAAAKAAEGNPPPKPADDGSTAEPKFTQKDLDRILAKELKPYKEKDAELQKLRDEQKQKELAEMSEIEKLKAQILELTQFRSRAEDYEATFKVILDAKLAAVPDDKKALIPEGLSSTKLLEWIERNSKALYGLEPVAPAAPGGGKPPLGSPDVLMEEAVQMTKRYYPRMDEKSEWFKNKVNANYEILKTRPAAKT